MKVGVKALLGALIAASCLVSVPFATAAPPPNDDLANAQTLSGPLPISAAGSNVEATEEAGEPFGAGWYFDSDPAGSSVWFSWEASVSGWVTAATCGSGFDSYLDVYARSTGFELERVVRRREGTRPDCGPGGSQATFKAVAGTIYKLRVDGNPSPQPPDATAGAIALQLALTPTPANDDFAAAQTVVAESLEGGNFFRVDAPGFNWNATKEQGEPAHGGEPGGASVWYSWTAPASGEAKMVVSSGAFESQLGEHDGGVLAAYTGDSLGSLAPIGSPGLFRQEVNVDVSAGSTYKIAVDGRPDPTTGLPKMGQLFFLIYLEREEPSLPREVIPPPDTTAPDTSIVKREVRPGRRKARFVFGSTEPGIFLCKLDGRKQASCGSPQVYAGLATGAHTVKVRAVDRAGNVDRTPAVARFSIPRSRVRR